LIVSLLNQTVFAYSHGGDVFGSLLAEMGVLHEAGSGQQETIEAAWRVRRYFEVVISFFAIMITPFYDKRLKRKSGQTINFTFKLHLFER
jgi:hypothetical protein